MVYALFGEGKAVMDLEVLLRVRWMLLINFASATDRAN